MMDRHYFAVLFEALCAAFRVEPSEPLAMAYWLGLKDLDAAAFEQAVGRAMREAEHMPKPVELRRLAGERTEEERSVVAWSQVRDAVRRVGAYGSVDFDDPAINAALRAMGGWPRLCGLNGDEFDVWAAKEFARQYAAWSALRVTPESEQARPLPGLSEQHNVSIGAPFELHRIGSGGTRRELVSHQPVRLIEGPTEEMESEPTDVTEVVRSVGRTK